MARPTKGTYHHLSQATSYTHTHTHTHTHTRTCIVVAYTYLRVYFMITTTVAHRATLFLLVSKELNDIVF